MLRTSNARRRRELLQHIAPKQEEMMATATQPKQLTFNVGGEEPTISIVRVSGGATLQQDLDKGDEVHVIVSTMDGEIVANGYGHVVAVTFKDTRDEHGTVTQTERIQTVKIS
jgi:hypothetical protein